jgi:hypothetical protein
MADQTKQPAEERPQDDSAANKQPQPGRRPLTERTAQSLIDQRIAQAINDGMFDNLPGQGKPQHFDDESLVPDDLRLGFRLLKDNGFAPPWIEARKDIDKERAETERWLAETNRRWAKLSEPSRNAAGAEFRQKLSDLYRTILIYNLNVPPGAAQLPNITIADELRRLGEQP